jgi:hypothetical protein
VVVWSVVSGTDDAAGAVELGSCARTGREEAMIRKTRAAARSQRHPAGIHVVAFGGGRSGVLVDCIEDRG